MIRPTVIVGFMWPFKRKPKDEDRVEAIPQKGVANLFPIGPFRIDSPVPSEVDVHPLPAWQIAILGGISFEGESIVSAANAQFLGLEWEVVLAVVDGIIYKISIQFTGDSFQAKQFAIDFSTNCARGYSKGPIVHGAEIWDASDGNVCTDSNSLGPVTVVTVTLTSNSVRYFRPFVGD